MTSNFIVEPCLEIIERDSVEIKASFRGSLQDAPSATSTSIVNGLSQQLIYQLQLIVPNAFVSFDDLSVDLSDAAFPYVQASAKQTLQSAIQDRGMKMQVNSAYRTIAQQMLLYNDRFNNGNPVAPPGTSNHQTGLAIDIEDPRGWEPYLMKYGWNPLSGDPPHFNYEGGGTTDISQFWRFSSFGTRTTPTTRLMKMKALDRKPKEHLTNRLPTALPKLPGMTSPEY